MTTAASRKRAPTLVVAEFDPRLKAYFYYGGMLLCIASIIGIVLLPLWLFFGRRYIERYFDGLHCELTTRALHFQKGIWFQTKRSIPLDKIQDLTFKEGPVLRYFGLSTLKIETAGQSSDAASDLSLTGIVGAAAFREQVLDQRDEVTGHRSSSPDHQPEEREVVALLKDIRDALQRIDTKLEEQ